MQTAGIGHNSWPPPHPGGMCILTAEGWKQLIPQKYEVRKPLRVKPLAPSRIGKEPVIQLDEDYDDQGRYLGRV